MKHLMVITKFMNLATLLVYGCSIIVSLDSFRVFGSSMAHQVKRRKKANSGDIECCTLLDPAHASIVQSKHSSSTEAKQG